MGQSGHSTSAPSLPSALRQLDALHDLPDGPAPTVLAAVEDLLRGLPWYRLGPDRLDGLAMKPEQADGILISLLFRAVLPCALLVELAIEPHQSRIRCTVFNGETRWLIADAPPAVVADAVLAELKAILDATDSIDETYRGRGRDVGG